MTNTKHLTPTPLPKYIYKILPSSSLSSTKDATAANLPLALPLSALDSKDGFIHLSTSYQLLGTLRRFFGSEPHVYILRIPYSRVEDFVKWEDVEGNAPDGEEWAVAANEKGYFPHVYANDRDGGVGEKGLKLGREEVDAVGMWVRRGTEGWCIEGWPFEEDRPMMG